MKSRQAFTLIELLVVIAIIGILAALLLGSVSSARNHAAKATDMDNLREIMIAVHVYADDNNDALSPPNWDNGGFGGAQGTNAGWLYAVNLQAAPGSASKFDVTTGLLWNALSNPKIYFCPMDSPAASLFKQRPQQISSYAMNGGVIGYMDMAYPPQKLGAMWSGACAFWETDENFPQYFNDGANFPAEGVSGRHLAGGVQALFDASVSYVKTNFWYQDAASTNMNRLWCYPGTANGHGSGGDFSGT
jgi:prepilin-type N-terminal cleavage/methylation domain-containing protein